MKFIVSAEDSISYQSLQSTYKKIKFILRLRLDKMKI